MHMVIRFFSVIGLSAAIIGSAVARDPKLDSKYSKTYKICMNTGDAAQGVQPAMNSCAADEYNRQDRRLNVIYGNAIAKKSGKGKTALRLSQRKWIITRDKICATEEKKYEGGSIAPLIYFTCMTDETIMRISWLEKR
jgi:uncharacterized protein YecT (DUF1311 family)